MISFRNRINPFREALEGWDEDHWIKGALYRSSFEGGMRSCAIGRLDSVIGVRKRVKFHHFLADVAVELFPSREFTFGTGASSKTYAVMRINDYSYTTWEDVVLIFTVAAERWDKQHGVKSKKVHSEPVLTIVA